MSEEGAPRTAASATPPTTLGPGPVTPAEPDQRRRRMRAVRLVAVVAVIALLVAVTVTTFARGWPPSEQELREQAGIDGKDLLRIGVKDDQPGVAARDPATGDFSGFDVEIAYLVAAELGFRPDEVRFLAIESEDRSRMQAQESTGEFVTVDLVIASYSVTEEREAQETVSFSQPYLQTEQSVLTASDYPPVASLAELRDQRVCTLTTSTSSAELREAGVDAIGRNRMTECVAGVLSGDFDAATTDAAILGGFVSQEPERLRLHDIGLDTQERWGVNTGGNEPLRQLVDLALYRSFADPEDRRWEAAFERYLAPAQGFSPQQQIAVDTQPPVDEVEVREWP